AAPGAVEGGLKLITGVEEQVDGTGGVGVGGKFFPIAGGFETNDRGSGGEDSPVYGIGEGLVLRKAIASARRRQLRERRGTGRGLLGVNQRSKGKSAKNCCANRAHSHR